MSFQVNVPPTMTAKLAKSEELEKTDDDDTAAQRKKREDWKKLKELEEARKAGTAPAMKDEEGKDINPHIPQYIMQAPWYFGATQPTLRHQREPTEWKKDYTAMDVWYKKGVNEESRATKYRKGACENCGAMTHKKKDCLERPRKLGAKYTGQDIAADEHLQPSLEFDYEGKRDRWNGYDPAAYRHVVEEYQKIEEAKRELKAQKIDDAVLEGNAGDDSETKEVNSDDDDEDKYADDMAMPGQKFETKQRITVRNLRIREDTAKYLLNLDINSAHYDPKTRAMRENPFEGKGINAAELPFAGDNFVRWSGDAHEMSKRQLFAWEAYEKGTDAHVQADPTKLELLAREFNKRKDAFVESKKETIVSKYGGEEHLDAPPKQLLLAQTDEYVEYSRHGTLLKGQEKAHVKSRFEEDIYINNHTSVWGSYWRDGRWGYKCCHSFIRESYCLGQAGKDAEQEAIEAALSDEEQQADKSSKKAVVAMAEDETPFISVDCLLAFLTHVYGFLDTNSPRRVSTENQLRLKETETSAKTEEQGTAVTTWVTDPSQTKSLLQQHLERLHADEKKAKRQAKRKDRKHRRKEKRRRKTSKSDSDDESSSTSDSEDDDKDTKLKKALAAEDARLKEVEAMMSVDERHRPYNVRYDDKSLTDEQIDAYQRRRIRDEDPMAHLLTK